MTTGFEPRYSLVGSTFVSTMTLAQIHQNNYEILSTFQFCAIMVDYLFTLLDTVCGRDRFQKLFYSYFRIRRGVTTKNAFNLETMSN